MEAGAVPWRTEAEDHENTVCVCVCVCVSTAQKKIFSPSPDQNKHDRTAGLTAKSGKSTSRNDGHNRYTTIIQFHQELYAKHTVVGAGGLHRVIRL